MVFRVTPSVSCCDGVSPLPLSALRAVLEEVIVSWDPYPRHLAEVVVHSETALGAMARG